MQKKILTTNDLDVEEVVSRFKIIPKFSALEIASVEGSLES